MTYATERGRVGKKPFQIVKLSLDYCTLRYGVSPCEGGVISTGFVQSAGSNTAVLDIGASSLDGAYDNYAISIIAGTGSGQTLRILSYTGSSREVTVEDNWSTTPDATSQYNLIKRPNACHNTRKTCQDPDNYTPSTTSNVIYLTEPTPDFPISLLDTSGLAVALPCLKKVDITPPKLVLGKGLGVVGTIKVQAYDFPHHDRGLDQYVDSRDYDPDTQGTFWGKLLARNPFYDARDITVFRGYLEEDGTYDINNFEQWTYIIEKIDGPNRQNLVTITAKDALKLSEDKRAQVPQPTTGTLLSGITAVESTATLTPAGIGDSEYDSSGYVRINEEIIAFTRSSDTLTLDTRADWGTTADAHDAGDAVQMCKAFEGDNVVDIVEDLLTNHTNIGASRLDTANWATEKSSWLNSNTLTNILTKPVGVSTILDQLAKENLFYIWWNPVEQLVKLKAVAPTSNPTDITDDNNIIAGSMSVTEDTRSRISQVWVYYGVNDYTEDKIENFKNLYIAIDTDKESDNQYGQAKVERIQSNWIISEGLAIQLAGRLLAIYGDNPKIARFKLDNKDDISLGDPIRLSSRYIQDFDGSNLLTNLIVVEDRETEPGTTNEFVAQQFEFGGGSGFIGYSQRGEVQSATTTTIVLQTDTADPSVSEPDITIDGGFTWDDDILVDHVVEMLTGAAAGETSSITAYNASTKEITFFPELSTAPSPGDIYEFRLPEYSDDALLKEDGGFILLENGGKIILEQASTQGATEDQKSKYAWIAPDSGSFDNGDDAYTIL